MQWKLPKNETLIKIAIALAFAALLYFVLFRRERQVPTWGPSEAHYYEDEMYEDDYEHDDYEDDYEDDDDNQVVYDDDAGDNADSEDDDVDSNADLDGMEDDVLVAPGDDDELAYDEELAYEDDYEDELEPFELYDSTVAY